MANYNPNTSGLVSLADRPNNERTTIQSQGGVASGQKRREIKRIADIVNNIRADCDEDPCVLFVRNLLLQLSNKDIKVADAIKILTFLTSLESNTTERSNLVCSIEVMKEMHRRFYVDED